MDLQTLRTRVYTRTGYTSSDQSVTATIVDQFINEANDFIGTLKDWPWMRRAVSGNLTGTTIPLTGYNWTRIHAMEVNNVQLTALSEVDWMERVGEGGYYAAGQPEYYRLTYSTGGVVQLYPAVTGTEGWGFSIVMSERDDPMTLDTDVPSLPEQYQGAIIEYAAHLVFRMVYQFDKAAQCLQSFDRIYNAMVDNRRLSTGPRRIRLRRWW